MSQTQPVIIAKGEQRPCCKQTQKPLTAEFAKKIRKGREASLSETYLHDDLCESLAVFAAKGFRCLVLGAR
jgi:hypothetical protein